VPIRGATPIGESGKPIGVSGDVMEGRGRPMGGNGGNDASVETDDCAAAAADNASKRITAERRRMCPVLTIAVTRDRIPI
jgi:hypothetical protein